MASRENLILLDTHIWVWSVFRSPRLEARFAELIDARFESVCVSVTSCWEIAMLAAKRRIDLTLPTSEWFGKVFAQSGIRVLPITPEVTVEAYELPGRFHQDPADRMIVATARLHKCLLITEDEKIVRYPFVETAE
ncbi:MAG: type II toxin-antitoxin system VapC family toxin [Bacteroidota bacterium]|nr:type II toxin-antitoxin system VapC family toxin [Bacteroidota bacterium]MDP4233637.1 type II toxin-antitoxin system VapC family toxin [Bacteroidota bacterium]MDP4243103.1 type II toxin-antitoxin system VapC family toxin [Bacteroidota bacterium]MDP4288451.1 type II toxin-antitoxin system VapC family toxin [Bacteroidota bacterium]